MKSITIYCDGGVTNNGKANKDRDQYGAYCSLLINSSSKDPQKIFTNVVKDASNNQMELQGAITPLLYLVKYVEKSKEDMINVTIISDSQYLVKGCNEWLPNWKKRGWTDSNGKTIKNLEMWKLIDNLLSYNKLNITLKWVRGHKGKSTTYENDKDSFYNEMCDTLLTEELKPYRARKR